MAEVKKPDSDLFGGPPDHADMLFDQADTMDEEDDATLAAIDRGIEAAEQGRVVSAEEARKRMEQWLSKSSTPKPH